MVHFGDSRLPQRFWDKVSPEPNSGCWLWVGAIRADYGSMTVDGVRVRTHRLALQIKLGRPIAPDLLACHTCDNPVCVNPDHLWEGSHRDNVRDMLSKGRGGANRRTASPAKRGPIGLPPCKRGHVDQWIYDWEKGVSDGRLRCETCRNAGRWARKEAADLRRAQVQA